MHTSRRWEEPYADHHDKPRLSCERETSLAAHGPDMTAVAGMAITVFTSPFGQQAGKT